MTPPLRLLVVAARQRQGWFNRQLAAVVAAQARAAGATVTEFDDQGGLKDARTAVPVRGVVDALLALAGALVRGRAG